MRLEFVKRLDADISAVSAPTLSVGLAIAHHLDTLTGARTLAKRAERAAKRERNSLGIVLAKRSGVELEWAESWTQDPRTQLLDWCRLFWREEIPDGVAFELEEILRPLETWEAEAEKLPEGTTERKEIELEGVALALAHRTLGRKRSQRGAEPMSEELADLLASRFKDRSDTRAALRELSAELQIARVFLSALIDAWGPLGSDGAEVAPMEGGSVT